MQINELKEYVLTGRELEFKVDGKMCSITYGTLDDHDVISFCEFNQPSSEVSNFDELLKLSYKRKSIEKIWKDLKPEDLWIY